ncbi:hypothetical protein ACHAXS_006130 [Conticribra weissflogii]
MKKITPVTIMKNSVMRYTPLDIRTERNADIAASDYEDRTAKNPLMKSHRRRKGPPILSPSPRGVILKNCGAQTKRRYYGAQTATERKLRRRSRKSQAAAAAATDTPDASKFDFKTDYDEKLVNKRKKKEKYIPSGIERSIDFSETTGNAQGNGGHGDDELNSACGFDDSGSDSDSSPVVKRWFCSNKKKNRLFILEDDESEDDVANGDCIANEITAKKGSDGSDKRCRTIKKHYDRVSMANPKWEKVDPKPASQISDSEDNCEFGGRHTSANRRARGNDIILSRKVSMAKESPSDFPSEVKTPSTLQKRKAVMIGKAAAARSPYVAEAYAMAAASMVTETRNEILRGKVVKSAGSDFPKKVMKDIDGDSVCDLGKWSDDASAYSPSHRDDSEAVVEKVNPRPRHALARKKHGLDMVCANSHESCPVVKKRGIGLQHQQKPKFRESRRIFDPSTDTSHNHSSDDDTDISFKRHVAKQPNVVLKSVAVKKALSHLNYDEKGEQSEDFDEEDNDHGDQYVKRDSNNEFALEDAEQNSYHAEDKVSGKNLSNIYTQLEDPVVGSHSESDESEHEISILKQSESEGFDCDSLAEKRHSQMSGYHSKGNSRSSNHSLELETSSNCGSSVSEYSPTKEIKNESSQEDAIVAKINGKLHRSIRAQSFLVRRNNLLSGIDCFENENESVVDMKGIHPKSDGINYANNDDKNSSESRAKRNADVNQEEFGDCDDEYNFVEFNTRNISKVDPETLIAALQTQPLEIVQSTQLSRANDSSNVQDAFPNQNLHSDAAISVTEADDKNEQMSISEKCRELENLLARSIEIMHEIKSSISVE